MQYHSIFAYASRLRALGNAIILAGLNRHGLLDIVPSHGDIIHVLLCVGSCSMSELASRIGRTRSTTTVLVRKLERAGYVCRERDSADARGVRISLSKRGYALEPAFWEIAGTLENRIRERLTDEEVGQLETLLARCVGPLAFGEEENRSGSETVFPEHKE